MARDAGLTRLLFVRTFVRPTGGNVTVRDYFEHALTHRGCEASIFFPAGSRHAESDLWAHVPAGRIVERPDWDAVDVVVVNGKDWRLLPEHGTFAVVHLVQHLGYASDDELRGYLGRPAARVCVSEAVRDAILPYANGPCHLIRAGVDRALFYDDGTRRTGSVLIGAAKAPALGAAIAHMLRERGIEASALVEAVPRLDFARLLRAAGVFVALPLAAEGFYRPALEAMACGCAVVCADVLGNRAFCADEVTCLQPAHDDAAAHAAAVARLLEDATLRERIRRGGTTRAARFDLTRERTQVHALFDELFASVVAGA